MKLLITGSDLHDAAGWASRVVPARPPAPILSGLLLTARNELTISAFDFETAATVTTSATVTEPGDALVPARLLADIAKTVNRDVDVVVTAEDRGPVVSVRSGRSDWTLPALPVDDYPRLPAAGDPAGDIDGTVLRDALARVIPAAGRDDTVPMLTGVKLDSDGDRLTVTATDRFRLATCQVDWKPATDTTLDVLVPATTLATVTRIDSTATVAVTCDGSVIGVATDTHALVGRQMGEQFPRWQALMPERGDHAAVVSSEDLAAAVAQAQVAADEASHLPVDLAFTDGEVTVSAAGDDRSARCPADADLDGDPITLRLRCGFLRDALAAVRGPLRVQFGGSPTKPLLFTAEQAPGYRHLLMPVRGGE